MSFPTAASVTGQQIAVPVQNRPLVLNEGQMFHGQIKQLYPGQMAEIQIGGQKLTAKLEVPMKAGDSYYFQVNAVKPELQLKIISGPLQAKEGQIRQLSELMDAMQLPKTSEMQSLLTFVMKNRIPMTRESLLEAETLLKGVLPAARNEALTSIQKMVELKLPLTENIFRSLLGVETKEGLHSVLTSLRNALALDNTAAPQVKDTILSVLEKMAKPFVQATGGALLGQSILTLLDSSDSAENRFSTLQMLKSAGVLPERTSLANLQQVLSSLQTTDNSVRSASSASTIQSTTESATKFVQGFSQVLTRTVASNAVAAPFDGAKEQLLNLLGQQGTEKLAALLQTAERSENPVIQKAMQTAEVAVASMIDGKAVKDALQTVIRSFGLNYEAGLLGKEQDFGRLAETLKPQLLTLIQDPSVSATLREAAQTVVTRMNGPLLQSGENGVQHQLVMQVPLEFFGKRIDATVEWNGRMKEDGKIDSDFARILFYLELESIDKTVIDMQVQNRIISVTIFNENDTLKSIGAPLQHRLKEGLESVGYKLSGVFFKDFIEEEKIVLKQKKLLKADRQGVDFRI